MTIRPLTTTSPPLAGATGSPALPNSSASAPASLVPGNEAKGEDDRSEEVRKAFNQFVGETFYSQMLKAMRSTVDKPAYFHGGRGEEIFESQLDQVLAEKMTEASAHEWTGPMFELFHLQRS